MAKKYDHRKICSNRSYKIRDVCKVYKAQKLSEQTVRGWIREGLLDAIPCGRAHLIHGGVLKQFLMHKTQKRRKSLQFTEFKCWKCKHISEPINHRIKRLAKGRCDSIAAYVNCPNCDHEVERLYKQSDVDKLRKTFAIDHDAVSGLCDSSCSTRKAHIENTLKPPVCERQKTKPPDTILKNVSATKKAQYDNAQLTLL